MNIRLSYLFLIVLLGSVLPACKSSQKTAFRPTVNADVSGLERTQVTDANILYLRPDVPKLEAYSRFIIDPPTVSYADREKMSLAEEDIARMQTYLRTAVMAELAGAGYDVVEQPGDGVLRVHIRIHDMQTGAPLAQANAASLGLKFDVNVGSATMEVAYYNALAGRLDAVELSRFEGRRSRSNAGSSRRWGDIEDAFDQWAQLFREAVDRAHGNG